jgi:GT2 family glycosyltransferase
MFKKSGDPDLTIIIVSFNTRGMTLECLRSVFRQTQTTDYEVIVVDNNSQDGSAQCISDEFPDVQLIQLNENIGFARANNLAATGAKGYKILLLNPDTVVLDHAIDRLMTFAEENPACGIWGGRTLFADGQLNPASCWREMSLWSLACYALALTHMASSSPLFNPESYAGWDRSTVRQVDIVTGCLFLINRALWKSLGGFNSAFFMYAEEADLCHRARQAGARPMITPNATICHYGRAVEGKSLAQRLKLFKGKATLMRLHWSPFRQRLGQSLFLSAALNRWRKPKPPLRGLIFTSCEFSMSAWKIDEGVPDHLDTSRGLWAVMKMMRSVDTMIFQKNNRWADGQTKLSALVGLR